MSYRAKSGRTTVYSKAEARPTQWTREICQLLLGVDKADDRFISVGERRRIRTWFVIHEVWPGSEEGEGFLALRGVWNQTSPFKIL